MIINRVGTEIGVNVDRREVDVLADVTPGFARSLLLSVRACRMSDSARHIEMMTTAQVENALAEARAQYPDLDADTVPDGATPRDRTVHRVVSGLKQFLFDMPVVTETGL